MSWAMPHADHSEAALLRGEAATRTRGSPRLRAPTAGPVRGGHLKHPPDAPFEDPGDFGGA
nr:hypothetical protein GCM10017745_51700 [Saccharothrix mutabilis subsp. capreolus]